MLGKLSRYHAEQQMHKVKNFLGHSRNFAKAVDNGVNTFKNIYKVAAPILESYGVPTGHKYINSALSGYDLIKNNVMEHSQGIENHLNKAKESLGGKKSVKFAIS